MGGFTLILITIVGLIISLVASKTTKGKFVNSLLSFVFIYVISGFVTYTPDWEGYEIWISLDSGRDVLFNYLRDKIVLLGYGYKALHLIFTGLYSFFLVFFISRFEKRTYLVAILYIPLIYLFFAAQYRFFLGYFSMCLAYYFFVIQRKESWGVGLAIFARCLVIRLQFYFYQYFIFLQ